MPHRTRLKDANNRTVYVGMRPNVLKYQTVKRETSDFLVSLKGLSTVEYAKMLIVKTNIIYQNIVSIISHCERRALSENSAG